MFRPGLSNIAACGIIEGYSRLMDVLGVVEALQEAEN
jgi:hypothetical protein